jgi:hypothetical protein
LSDIQNYNTIVPLYSGTDNSNYGITNSANKVIFFRDDGSEHYAGKVDFIKIHNTVLTTAQMQARSIAVCNNPPPPPITNATYEFNNNLNEEGGGTPLNAPWGAGTYSTETYCGTSRTVYNFAAGQGLEIPAPLTGDYTIEMFVNLSNVSSYNRLLDMTNLTSSCGIYAVNGGTNFYCVGASSSGVISANQWVHLFFTRNATTKQVQSFLSDIQNHNTIVPLYSGTDNSNYGITNSANKVIFFRDNAGYHYAGKVDFIKIHDTVLTTAQMQARSVAVCNNPLPPYTIYEYRFEGNFAETNGAAPNLVQLGTGNFTTETICNSSRMCYNFDFNSGFYFDNLAAGNFVTNATGHTIELYMRFQNTSSWRRIVDYKNRTSDTGVYAYGGAFQFYNFATGGTGVFTPNNWVYVAVVREQDKTYKLYLATSPNPLASFVDNGGHGLPNAAGRISFFQDDLVVANEASAGSIALLRIHNRALTAFEISQNAADTCNLILPTEWLGFEAKAQNAFDAVLSWQTAQETDNSHFIVERSRDGLHFQAIGRVEGTNANHISNYSFIDEKAALYAENNHLYYRLRQVDFSGKESYSPIRQVVFEAGEEMQILSLAPNPFQNQFEVRYQIPTQAAVHFALYDMAGRILWQQTNTPAAGTHRQAIEAKQLAKGTYLLKVQYQNQSEVRKVVKE